MALQKKPTSLPPEVLAAAKERAAQARTKIEKVGRSNLHTPEELAGAAPFYFTLREYVRQLKEARQAAGLTLDDIASRTGMAVESLSRLETGANPNPTWKTLGLYAAAVGCAPRLSAEPVERRAAGQNAGSPSNGCPPLGPAEPAKATARPQS